VSVFILGKEIEVRAVTADTKNSPTIKLDWSPDSSRLLWMTQEKGAVHWFLDAEHAPLDLSARLEGREITDAQFDSKGQVIIVFTGPMGVDVQSFSDRVDQRLRGTKGSTLAFLTADGARVLAVRLKDPEHPAQMISLDDMKSTEIPWSFHPSARVTLELHESDQGEVLVTEEVLLDTVVSSNNAEVRHKLRIHHLQNGDVLEIPIPPRGTVSTGLDRAARYFAYPQGEGTVTLLNWDSKEPWISVEAESSGASPLCSLSPDGAHLITWVPGRPLRVWNLLEFERRLIALGLN
jgi:dipeptidyl aminopeptidase/acylaminoacyl peptidase